MITNSEIQQNKNLLAAISNCFFAAFLPDSKEVIEELINNQKEGAFDLHSLLSTSNEQTKSFLGNFLPNSSNENLFTNTELLNKVISHYESNKPEFGLPQSILQLCYDSRFRQELDKRADNVLAKTSENKSDIFNEFNLVPTFMNRVKDSWRIVDANARMSSARIKEGKDRLPYVSKFEWYNFSSVTERKNIGKKTSGSEPEKIDNIYSAYKVFGQGEYSKFLIGYKNNSQCNALGDYISEGLNSIYAKMNERYQKENNTKDDLIRLSFRLSDQKKYITEVDLSKFQYEHQKYFQITEGQIRYISNELQKFSGDYVPVCLDDKYNNSKTVFDNLYDNCRHLVGQIYKKRFDFDNYENGLPFEREEIQFINKFFEAVCAYRLDLKIDQRKQFDKETDLGKGLSFDLQRWTKTYDKMDLLENLEMVAKKSSIYDPIQNWFSKPTWDSLKGHRSLDNVEVLQEVNRKEKPLFSDDIMYKGGIAEDGQSFTGSFLPVDSDSHQIEEYFEESLQEDYEEDDTFAVDLEFNDSEDDEAARYLLSLFYKCFHNDGIFLETMQKLVRLQIEKKIMIDKDGKRVPDKTMDSYSALSYLFILCDSVHSYSRLWTIYTGTVDSSSDDLRDLFRNKMKMICKDYREHFKDKIKGD